MNSKVVPIVVAFILAYLLPIACEAAGFLDELRGYNSGYPQANANVTNSGQPQYPAAARYGTPAHTARPIPQQQPIVGQLPVPPRVAYQQPPAQNRVNPPQAPSSKAVSKKKPANNAAANVARRSVPALPPNQPQQVARSHQPGYPAQPRTLLPQGYGQTPPASYYANPYQTRYTTTPNYYQGYSYGAWGSSSQACAPGRA